MMTLEDLKTGESGLVVKVKGRGAFRKRILDMGFVRGKLVTAIRSAPLKDPIEYRLMDYHISLRRTEARMIEIIRAEMPEPVSMPDAEDQSKRPRKEHRRLHRRQHGEGQFPGTGFQRSVTGLQNSLRDHSQQVEVALVGNPNCGKTSIFNLASRSREHVGNYAGVTVESKMAVFRYNGYSYLLTDLPGTYSLTAYSPEELFVRNHLQEKSPDVVLNVIDATNLERNLYLTTQLIDMDVRMVIALNMYDEMEETGRKFNYRHLGEMLGIPIVPTVGITGEGIPDLFDRIQDLYEGKDPGYRHIHIVYDPEIEISIKRLQDLIWQMPTFSDRFSSRFYAIKLLEKDEAAKTSLAEFGDPTAIVEKVQAEINRLENLLGEDTETLISDARYGFIHGALTETLEERPPSVSPKITFTEKIDRVLTHKWLGFPIFLLFLWIMFQATFNLGKYPVEWIENGVALLSAWMDGVLNPGIFHDLMIDGIIGGVGGVIVFLPNIVILFLFISLMEDTGYMARVAFIMDKLMHILGLHGKSFIPLIMGFGCNVPAIMATRTIENRNDRLLTMLILPLMSCSARLPVYILIASALFPKNPGNVIFMMYLLGIALSVLVAMVMKITLFRKQEAPFVMELPPYRAPRSRATLKHMWFRSQQYLKKMGGIILIASVLIWALGYFPRTEGSPTEQLENSAIGAIGKTLQPIMDPLGFDWKMTVAMVTGVAAKEVVVSTLGVLYAGSGEENDQVLTERLKNARHSQGKNTGQPVFTQPAGLAFLLFVLIYIPCIAVLAAIRRESGGWKWAMLLVVYTTLLAWSSAWIGFQVGNIIF